ncbi:hypothetical protein CRG98_045060, partial [Punica granatum]
MARGRWKPVAIKEGSTSPFPISVLRGLLFASWFGHLLLILPFSFTKYPIIKRAKGINSIYGSCFQLLLPPSLCTAPLLLPYNYHYLRRELPAGAVLGSVLPSRVEVRVRGPPPFIQFSWR